MKRYKKNSVFYIFLFLLINLLMNNAVSQERFVIYESLNDSNDISNNFYDFSDSLLYLFYDTLFFTLWDTSYVHNIESCWEGLGDSIVLPLLLTSQQRYEHPYKGQVSSRYGYRRGRFHYGMDINLNDKDSILCAFDGIVRYTGYSGGYGNVVTIRHFNGLETVYAHLNSIETESGKLVFAGDVIGLGGRTGRAYGAHLHFEIRFRGIALNPQDIVDFEKFELLSDTLILYRKKFISVTSAHQSSASTSTVPKYHTIRKGDTLGHIAVRYGTTVTNLCKLNNISRNSALRIGQRLRVR